MNAEAVIFDYDGVLVNSYPAAFKVYVELAKRLGVTPFKNIQEMRNIYKLTHKEVNRYWGFGPEKDAEISQLYYEITANQKDNIPLVPGMKNVIEKLSKTHKLAIASGTSRKLIEERLQHHGLLPYFHAIVGREDITHPKPAPDALLLYLQKLGLTAKDTLFVGDMAADMLMGKAAGIKTVAFCAHSWNDETYVYDQKPDIIIKKPEQLLEIA